MANIAAIDYDPGASEVNQLNRIKLMLATAGKNAARKADEEDDLYGDMTYSQDNCPSGEPEEKTGKKKKSANKKKTGRFSFTRR